MQPKIRKFKLSEQFIEQYKDKAVPWGPVGYVTYKRTYSRRLNEFDPNATGTEEWYQTCRRVIEGMFDMQKQHVVFSGLEWNDSKAQRTAKEAYDRLFNLKWTPPGRGLWMMGTSFVDERTAAGLFNCGFKSTKEYATKGGYLFKWIMDALMLGIGVGFDTLGAGTFEVKAPSSVSASVNIPDSAINTYASTADGCICSIDDSREGWIESVQVLLDAFVFGSCLPTFDYSRIREKGAPIRGFGGTSSGYYPLKELHDSLIELYKSRIGQKITSTDIVDTENLIGKCVVAGNVRRSAALALGQQDDIEYLTMKNDKEKLYSHRWGSNNSFHAVVGMDYTWHAEQSQVNGEPGYIWLDNARTYGRMKDPQRFDDLKVMGFNPCVTGDTWVPTDSGYKQVIDLVGTEGISLQVNGRLHSAESKGFWKTGIKPVFKLTTDEGYELKLTADHKVLTENRGWVEAKYLNHGDKIVINNHRSAQLKTIDSQAHAAGFLLGLLVGDGTFAADQATLSFWDAQLAQEACAAYKTAFNAEEPSLTFIEDRSEWRLRRTAIIGIAAEWNINQNNKRNIDQLMSASDSTLRGFLRGLFDADGTVIGGQQKGVSIRLCQNDLPMLKSVQRMLLRLGITSTIYQNRRAAGKYSLPDGQGGYKMYSCKAMHELVISSENLLHFNDQIGFASITKQERLSTALDNYKRAPNETKFYAHFKNLEYLGEEDVYDVTVKDVHAFDANGLYVHNCVEQQLEDSELCCVSSDTRILTKSGNKKIVDLVGKEVEVWNGEEWSKVIPFLAAENKDLYRVYLSDGSYLDCTDDHKWSAKNSTAKVFRQFETNELVEGMKVQAFELEPIISGHYNPNAYRYGWFLGDGYVDGNVPLALVQEPEYSILEELNGVEYPEQHPPGYKNPFKRVNLSKYIDLQLAKHLRDSDLGLPDEFFEMDNESIVNFISGWIDTDGSVRRQKGRDSFVITSISHKKLLDAQILLRRIGINHTSIKLWSQAGSKTNYGIRSKGLYCLYIPSYESHLVAPKLPNKKATKFGSRYQVNNAHSDGKLIDMSITQKILKVEKLDGKHDTYCFTEPKKHMGIFGNVLTYQCLTETFPALHDSYEDYLRTLKIAYLYGKTVTLSKTQWAETNAIMLKNRRIGLSMSGVVQAFNKFGRREVFDWCDNAYNYVQKLDGIYSDWLCVPRSKRTTSIKPSGTVSLLNGSTPGVHFPEDEYYVRRIRFSDTSDLLADLESHGYHIEDDAYSPNTKVVSFPVHEPFFVKGKREVSMWEQLEISAAMQYYWADNSVSVTVTFKPEEGPQIKDALQLYESRLKAVSFLRYEETGYVQAPYEPITKEKFEEMSAKITPIQRFTVLEQGGAGTKFCDGDSCEI